MEGRPSSDFDFDRILSRRIPRLELGLVLITLLVSALFSLGGLALTGAKLLQPLALLLSMGFGYNLFLLWLDRRPVPEWVITWGARLGNLLFLTIGVHLTGGFRSPFLPLYAIYLVVASLRYGWSGAGRSLLLCCVSWAVLLAINPPVGVGEWAWAGMAVGVFGLIALVVGVLASRHVAFWQESLQRNRELVFLSEAGRLLAASLNPQEVLAGTLARVSDLLDVEAASLALVDPITGHTVLELAIGGGSEVIKGVRLEPGQGIVGRVIQEGQPVLVSDVSADPHWYAGVDQMSGYRTRSILCVPLQVKGQVIGALEVLNKRDGPFTLHDQRLLSSLADLAAQCIENARLHEQVQHHASRLQEAYREVSRLDELKSAFIRNVSHELRTPLTLIKGYVELLLEDQLGPLRPEQRQGLTVVMDRVSHLISLVNDIITLQTIGAMGFDLEVISMAILARAAVDAAHLKAKRSRLALEMRVCQPEDRLLVRGDARRLRQTLDHLLDNAIKFSPGGGTVVVSVGREGEMVQVSVQDEGIGLDTAQLEQIWERFYQVDSSSARRFGGIGLGLALVKEVVEAHGGAVWVESTLGQGSTFSIFLPAYDRREPEPTIVQRMNGEAEGGFPLFQPAEAGESQSEKLTTKT